MPPCWAAPGFRRCCSGPEGRGSTARKSTSSSRMSFAAAIRWPRWPANGAKECRIERRGATAAPVSGGFAQHQPGRNEPVTTRVTLEALTRRASADFPTRRVVPTRCAAHVHALAFEVQDCVMPTQPAQELPESRHRPHDDARCALGVQAGRCRESLGIIRDHLRSTFHPRTPARLARFRPSHLRDIKAHATAVADSVNRKLVSDLSQMITKNRRLATART